MGPLTLICLVWMHQASAASRKGRSGGSNTCAAAYDQPWFDTWVSQPGLWESIREAWGSGKFIHIRNALRQDLAEQLHRIMDTATGWQFHEMYGPFFNFNGHSLEVNHRGNGSTISGSDGP